MSSVTGPLWRLVSPYRQGRADIADEQAVRELRAALSHCRGSSAFTVSSKNLFDRRITASISHIWSARKGVEEAVVHHITLAQSPSTCHRSILGRNIPEREKDCSILCRHFIISAAYRQFRCEIFATCFSQRRRLLAQSQQSNQFLKEWIGAWRQSPRLSRL